MEKCNLCTSFFAAESWNKLLHESAVQLWSNYQTRCISPISLMANPQRVACNSTYCSHGPCLCVVYMKNTSYKTNQTDSLQMETKVQSQLRSDLIHCLSSDSMRSHPEIPHKPHLLSIWPCSHAIQYCTAARPTLQRQQGSALKRFNEENKSGWGRIKGYKGWDWCNCIGRKGSGNDSTDAIIGYWFVVVLSCMCIV